MNCNEILNTLDTIDRYITIAFNYDGGAIQDGIWTVFSSRLIWLLPAIALIAHLLYNKQTRKQTLVVVFALALIITLCDQTTSTLMKPFFARLRPSHTPGVMDALHYVGDYRGGLYGFASSHAANSFGAVTFVALLIKRRLVTVAMTLLALCVCYSRIYLGVHFFGDLLVGGIIGCFFGYTVYMLTFVGYPYVCHRVWFMRSFV